MNFKIIFEIQKIRILNLWCRPMLAGRKSSSTVQIQAFRGCPRCLSQVAGKLTGKFKRSQRHSEIEPTSI